MIKDINDIFFIIFFILAAVVVWTCLGIIKLLRREKREPSLPKDFGQIAEDTPHLPPRLHSANELFLRISEDFKKRLEELIEKEAQKNMEEFKNDFQKTSEEIIKSYKSQFAIGNQEIQGVLKEFSQQTFKENEKIFAQVYQSVKETLVKKVQETEKEIENYKKERFKELDRKIYQLLGEVAKKTIGKAIDLSGHEKLVVEALEKAKKEIF